jgi:TfoX/Sxy family transcriptional regulator of competence genes
MPEASEAQARFAELVARLVGRDGVTFGAGRRGFGYDALQVDGRIFAMVSRGRLVLKLSRERVAALIATGAGAPFDAGKGKPMNEWVVLEQASENRLLGLAQEALAFAAGVRSSPD